MVRKKPRKRTRRKREEEEELEEEDDDDEDDDDEEDYDEDYDDDDDDDEETETLKLKSVSSKQIKKIAKKAKKAMEEDFDESQRLPICQFELGEYYNMTLEEISLTQYRQAGEYHNAGDGLVRVIFSGPDCVRLVAEKLAEGKQWLRKRKELSNDLPMDVVVGISKERSRTSSRSFHFLYLEEQ